MAKQFASLDDRLTDFISRQHIFFAASAAADTRVNVSPRGAGDFRVLGPNAAAYIDRTGSGNETAAHLKADGRLTIMFCSFDQVPMILRLYGRGTVLHRDGQAYTQMLRQAFDGNAPPGIRQIVRIDFDLVQTSCGFGVPLFDYVEERPTLERWAAQKADLADYWREKNVRSMDGLPTGIFDDNTAF
jgi:hypothetical protein